MFSVQCRSILPISFRITSLALTLSYDYKSTSEAALMHMDIAINTSVEKFDDIINIKQCTSRPRVYPIQHSLCTLLVLQWHHNENDDVSNHQPHDCLLNCLFSRRSKKPPKLRVRGIHQWPVNSPHKGPVTRKLFPFDDVIMDLCGYMPCARTFYTHVPSPIYCYWNRR